MTRVETGITNIPDLLAHLGVEVTNVGEREILGRCPVHIQRTGKKDRSPSWSMNASTGAWICFSCGARGSLMGLVNDLTGSTTLAYDFYASLVTTSLENLSVPLVTPKVSVDWDTYSKFTDIPESELSKRSLTEKACRLHGVRWDKKNECWVIPIVDKDRTLLGWQSKKTGWVRNFPVGVKKSNTLFGIERFTGGTAILLESPLDVVRLTSIDHPLRGLASFGTAISKVQVDLLSQVARRVIVAMDNDDAGVKASKSLFESLPRFRDGVAWLNYDGIKAKDIGEMNDDEIMQAIDTATVIPGWLL